MKKHTVPFSFALAALAMLVTACGDGSSSLSPTGPSAVSSTQASAGTTPTETAPPANPAPGSGSSAAECGRDDLQMSIDPVSGQFVPALSGAMATLRVKNVSAKSCQLVFSSWDRNDSPSHDPLSGQVLVDWKPYVLQSGQEVTMGPIRVPDGCYQLDVHNGTTGAVDVRTMRAIRWYTGGTCRPTTPPPPQPPPPPPTPTCEGVSAAWEVVTVNLDASPAEIRLRARLGGTGVTGQWMRTPPGIGGPIGDGRDVANFVDRPPFGSPATSVEITLEARVGSEVCDRDVRTYSVQPLPPPTPTCEGASVTLDNVPGTTFPTAVNGQVVVGLAGTGITGSLVIPGIGAQPVTNGQRVNYSFPRPPAGQPAVTHTITLTGTVGDQACATRNVTVVVPPQERQPTCEGVNGALSFASGPETNATAVVGSVLAQYSGGFGTSATLAITGLPNQAVSDGQVVPFSFLRPPAGSDRQHKEFLLTITAGGEVCKTRRLEVKVVPLNPPCTHGCK